MPPSDRSIAVCASATVLCLAILLWAPGSLLDLAAAAPLVFYLPGWALLRAFGAEPGGRFEFAVLSVALSLAIVVIVGVLLNFAGSIDTPEWLASLGLITFGACAVSLVRARRTKATGFLEAAAPSRARSAELRSRDIQAIALAVGLGAAAIASSVFLRLHFHEFYYTQLWIVPQPNAPDNFVVGLHSAEAGEESYAVDLLVDRRLVQSWHDVSLKPGQSWTTTFRWVGFGNYPRTVRPLKETEKGQETKATIPERVGLGAVPRVEALVYRSKDPSVVYRHVWSAPDCATDENAHGRPPCEF